jgi:hypothetical protein
MWDHLVSVLHLYPFRCQLCSARFRAFQGRHYSQQGTDQREYDRLFVRVPVTLDAGGERAEGETVDLSLSGCSLRTDATFAPGTTVHLRLRLGQAGDVEVQSAIVRSHRDSGMGLQFVQIAANDRKRLSRYLERFLRPTGTGRRRPGRPRPEVVVAALVGVAVIVVVLLWIGRLGGLPVH